MGNEELSFTPQLLPRREGRGSTSFQDVVMQDLCLEIHQLQRWTRRNKSSLRSSLCVNLHSKGQGSDLQIFFHFCFTEQNFGRYSYLYVFRFNKTPKSSLRY